MLSRVDSDLQICGAAELRTDSSISDRLQSAASHLDSAPRPISTSNGPLGAFMQQAIDTEAMRRTGEDNIRGGARNISARFSDGSRIDESTAASLRALSSAPSKDRKASMTNAFLTVKRFSACGHALSAPISNRMRPTPAREERCARDSARITKESLKFLLSTIKDPSAVSFLPATQWHK